MKTLKYLFFTIIFLTLCIGSVLANVKVSELTVLSAAPEATDILLIVDDPSGSPTSKQISVEDLFSYLNIDTTLSFSIFESDEVTVVADGTKFFTVPESMNGMELIAKTASVADLNSATGGETTVMIRRVRSGTAVDMLSPGIEIPYDSYTSSSGTISASNDDLQTGDQIYIDVDSVTTGAAHKGLSVSITFRK